MLRLFKKDWEYHFHKMISARDAFYGKSSWSMQKIYLRKWESAITKAEDYLVLLDSTKDEPNKLEKMRQVVAAEKDKMTTAAALSILKENEKRKSAEEKKSHRLKR